MHILTIAIASILSSAAPHAASQTTEGFPDVPRTHWAYEAVTDLKAKGILIGYPAQAEPAPVQSPKSKSTPPPARRHHQRRRSGH